MASTKKHQTDTMYEQLRVLLTSARQSPDAAAKLQALIDQGQLGPAEAAYMTRWMEWLGGTNG